MGALLGGARLQDQNGFWSGMLGMFSTTSGEKVTEQSALTLSSYFACQKVLSEDVAKLPFVLMQEKDGSREPVKATHPVQKLMQNLNPNTTNQALRESVNTNAAGWGFGIAEIQSDAQGRPVALWPIHPSRVTPRCVSGQIVWDVLVDDCDHKERAPGAVVRLLDEEVFVLHGFGSNGIVGYSVLQYASECIGLGLAAQRFGAAFFGSGAMPSIVIKHPGRLKADAAANLRQSWEAAHQGAGKARRPVVVEEGVMVETLSINPDDGQFLETRQFQVEEVCRWFRMPPVKIQHNQNTPYSNIDSLDRTYVKDTLDPWLTRWEQEAKRKLLLTREQEKGYFFDHDVSEQLRLDAKTQAEVDRTNVASGVDSLNEVRRRQRKPAIPGGDAHFMQQGFTTVEAVANGDNLDESSEPVEDEQSDPEPEEDNAQKAVSHVILAGAVRLIDRETKALARAQSKHTGDELEAWCKEFYLHQAAIMKEVFAPAVAVWQSLTGVHSAESVGEACDCYCSEAPSAVTSAEDLAAKIQAALEK